RKCNWSIGTGEPRHLPLDMARKLETAAAQFKEHWESGCITPAAPTADPAAKIPKVLDPALVTLLRSVESGKETGITDLADWLEERGDPRATAVRDVARLEAILRENGIYFVLDGKRIGPFVSVMRSPDDTEDWLAQRVREARCREQSNEVWLRLGLTQTLSD